MGEIASADQIRMGLARWALVCVPGVVLLGYLSSWLSGPGGQSLWYQALAKPAFTPPNLAFPIVWTLLYAMMGLALAMVLNARGSRRRWSAVTLFAFQLILNLAWTPLFFGAHQVAAALILIAALLVSAALTAWRFLQIRRVAGWLMVPYIAWLVLAAALNFEINRLNPDAETFDPAVAGAEFNL